MTPRQIAADAAHLKARRAYETAEHGDRERRRVELEASVLEVLRADVEARDTRKPPMEMRA